jgi:hypothetical protein
MIKLGQIYTLNGNFVVPYDGETRGQLGMSAGFIHYDYIDGVLSGETRFCGVDYFEKNASLLSLPMGGFACWKDFIRIQNE